MPLLSQTDAAAFLGVSRRSLGRHRAELAERGLAKPVGGRWMYEDVGLKAAWLEVAHHQIGNSETLDRMALEVAEDRRAELQRRAEIAAGTAEFWQEFGRWAPDEPLTSAEHWQHVAAIAAAMAGLDLAPEQVAELLHQVDLATADVSLGARWDAGNWAAGSARLEAEG